MFGFLLIFIPMALVSQPLWAAPSKQTKKPTAAATATATAAAAAAATATAAAAAAATAAPPPATLTATEFIAQAQKLYDSLEYDRVAPLAALALAKPEATLEEKLVAYQLQGSAMAIIGDPTVAEGSFSLLLSMRPDFMLPEDTPPKIRSVFAGVKATVDANRKSIAATQRKELAATVEFTGTTPPQGVGGRPVRFDLGVTDPRGVVKSVRVQYRKRSETEYLSLPLARDPQNAHWAGAVPGEWTASDAGFAMEVIIIASDSEGPLKQLRPTGGAEVNALNEFLSIEVSPGQVDRTQRPVPVWVFGTAAGVTSVLALASGSVAGATAFVNSDYHRKLDASTPENPASGPEITAQASLGSTLNLAQLVGWGAAGVGLIVTGVLALFTNWDGSDLNDQDVLADGPAAAAVVPAS